MRFGMWLLSALRSISRLGRFVGRGFRPLPLNRLRGDASAVASGKSGNLRAHASHDLHLLETVKNLWAFGEYRRVVAVEERVIQDHPQRALLAAYVGLSHEQIQHGCQTGLAWLERAKQWGCPSDTLIELALANVHASLAELKLMVGDESSAHSHLSACLELSAPAAPADLVLPPRLKGVQQARQLMLDANGAVLPLPSAVVQNVSDSDVFESAGAAALIITQDEQLQTVLDESLGALMDTPRQEGNV